MSDELSIRLEERLAAIQVQLEQINEKLSLQNGRIDRLEAWRDRILGAGAIVSILLPIVTALVVRGLG